jgi:hypothetical protein
MSKSSQTVRFKRYVDRQRQSQTVAIVKSRLSQTHRMKGIFKPQDRQCKRQ